jgi:hypothetical protein
MRAIPASIGNCGGIVDRLRKRLSGSEDHAGVSQLASPAVEDRPQDDAEGAAMKPCRKPNWLDSDIMRRLELGGLAAWICAQTMFMPAFARIPDNDRDHIKW